MIQAIKKTHHSLLSIEGSHKCDMFYWRSMTATSIERLKLQFVTQIWKQFVNQLPVRLLPLGPLHMYMYILNLSTGSALHFLFL